MNKQPKILPVDNEPYFMSMGRGREAGGMFTAPPPQPVSPEQQIKALRNQAKMLVHQLHEIHRRIEELGRQSR